MARYLVTESQYNRLLKNPNFIALKRRLSEFDADTFVDKLMKHLNICKNYNHREGLDEFYDVIKREIIEQVLWETRLEAEEESDLFFEYQDMLESIIYPYYFGKVKEYYNKTVSECKDN